MSVGFVISWVKEDYVWADWIRHQIADIGIPIQMEYPAGSNRVHEFNLLLTKGYRVLAVVSDDSIADPNTRAEWLHAKTCDLTGADRRLVPMLVHPCTLDIFRGLSAIHLYQLRDSTAADDLRAALGLQQKQRPAPSFPGSSTREAHTFRMVDDLIKQPPALSRGIPSPSDDPLPRLRLLTTRVRSEAGQVNSGLRDGSDFGAGLYVRRDVAPVLLERLRSDLPSPQLLVGAPGSGKTSVLWGLADELLAGGNHEVIFLKAIWLHGIGGQRALVDARMIAAAVTQADRMCTMLVDTADLVITGEEGHLALVEAVNAATDGGASVVVTSRPHEAQLAPLEWQQVQLANYATTTENGGSSEFARAVASHGRFYCRSAANARDMAAGIITAMARRRLVGDLYLRPLILRMLFQLYAPTTIPDNLDVTGLYYDFWRNRVIQDRGTWVAGESSATDSDLATTVRSLAVRMLRAGRPEVELGNSFDPGEGARVRQDVDLLVRRGVGEVLPGGSEGTFRFFHQTFFEFSAAQALLHSKHGQALSILEQRVREEPDDNIAVAVFEQVLLCSLRDDDLAPTAVGTTVRMLDEQLRSASTHQSDAPASLLLLQTLLSVLATAEHHLLGDFLEILLRPMGHLVRTVPTWTTVLDVLIRSAEHNPVFTAAVLKDLRLPTKAMALHRDAFAYLTQWPAVFLVLLPSQPDFAMSELRQLGQVAATKDVDSFLISFIHLVLARAQDVPEYDLSSWMDEITTLARKSNPAVIAAAAEVHRAQTIRFALRHGWSLVLAELKTLLATIDGGSPVASRDGALLGGILLALASEGPVWTMDVTATLLRGREGKYLHSELRRGWLTDYTRRCPNPMLDRWTDWLVEDLSDPRRRRTGAEPRWARTILNTLERSDVDLTVTSRIADTVNRRLPGDDVASWLDPNLLLPLLVRSSKAEIPAVREAWSRIERGHSFEPHTGKRVMRQAIRAAGSTVDWDMLVDLLIERGECGYLLQLLKTHRDVPVEVFRARAARLTGLVEASLVAPEAQVRDAAGNLLCFLARRDMVTLPSWNDLDRWLAGSNDVSVRRSLVRVAGIGVTSGHYPAAVVRLALTPLVARMPEGGVPPADAAEAGSVLVKLLARFGTLDDGDEVLRLAFRDPVRASDLVHAAAFVRPDHAAGSASRNSMRKFLLGFGRLLKAVSDPTIERTVVPKWRSAIRQVMEQTDSDELFEVLRELPLFDMRFAFTIVVEGAAVPHPVVADALAAWYKAPGGDPMPDHILMTLKPVNAVYGWPELPDLL